MKNIKRNETRYGDRGQIMEGFSAQGITFLYRHNYAKKPLKGGRKLTPVHFHRLLRQWTIEGKSVTKKLLQETLWEEVMVAWTRAMAMETEK